MSHDTGPDRGHDARPVTKSKLVITTFILSVLSLVWKIVDAVSNTEYLLQKLGFDERVIKFLSSPRGTNFLLYGALLSLILALVYHVRRYEHKLASWHEANKLPSKEPAQLEEKSIPAVPIARREAAGEVSHLRDSTESINVPAQERSASTQEQTAPNLTYSVIDHLPAHEEHGVLVAGHADGDSDVFVYGVKISNKSDPPRKVGSLTGVSAEIVYTPSDGSSLEVLRGSWLSETQYRVDFGVNDEHRLAIVGIPRRITQGAQLVFYFRRESSRSGTRIMDRPEPLDRDSYHIKIRLVTEAENTKHKELDYKLTITREPEFKIELVEDKQQPGPPVAQDRTPPAPTAVQALPVSGREAVLQALREFQVEGNGLLLQSVRNPFPDESAVYGWEDRLERYIKDNIGVTQAMEFIKTSPIYPYPGTTINRKLSNRIHTRLHHLGRLISAM